VGALTLKEFRFRSRVWFLQDVPSTCAGCARGCSIDIGEFRNQIFRITPRENEAVNRFWICDEGRLWGERMKAAAERRIEGPRVASGEVSDPWGAALAEAAELLQSHARGGKVRVLASPRATLEDTWLLASLAKGVLGGAKVHLPSHEAGEDDHLLIRKDRTPNARGARLVLEAVCGEVGDTSSLESALAAGEVELLLALGPGLVGPVDDETPVLSADALAKAGPIIAIDAFASPLSDAAQVVLSAASYAEVSGSYVNFAGRVQRVERALLPAVDARPLSMILADLHAQLSVDAPAPGSMEIGAKLSETVPALADIDWEALPASTGQNISGVDAAADAAPATGALVSMLAARDAAPAGTGD
jgi:NADH-quinone oxidoreductase subunit G